MHVLESEDDDKYCTQVRGGRTIPHLERLGFIGPDFIAVHCVCMEEEDFDIFKQYDVKVSHNPVSNMILASGVAPVERMVREGLTVSLACDGSASNDTQDMMEVLDVYKRQDQRNGQRHGNARPIDCVKKGMELFGWEEAVKEQEEDVYKRQGYDLRHAEGA